MNRALSILLCLCILLSFVGCNRESSKKYNMNFGTQDKVIDCSLSNNDFSEKVFLNKQSVITIQQIIDKVDVSFPYENLYQTEECYSRLNTIINVQNHKFSALNSDGVLDANYLLESVKDNNKTYLAENEFLLETPADDELLQICRLIVDTVNEMKRQQPHIDYSRVHCNLGSLKVLYKKGMVDNAQVTSDMVLHISPTMFQIVDIMTNENGCRNVVIHEVMHIVQMGCLCEEIKHCTRRCGISYYWDDFEFNTSDFRWLFEASAERSMCNLTGDELFTYEYMINYLCSLNLCTVLNENIPANYAETLSFYSDINNLYDMFDCKTKEDEYEILKMMIAINIIQTQPEELLNAYGEQNHVDVQEQSVLDDLNCILKPAIMTVFTKNFYRNLIGVLGTDESVSLNDACYLIALFEATLSNHIKYTNKDYDRYNSSFIALYKNLRNAMFEQIKKDCGIDILTYYEKYTIFENEQTKIVNASLKWCDDDKSAFFLERTDYLEFHINSKIL